MNTETPFISKVFYWLASITAIVTITLAALIWSGSSSFMAVMSALATGVLSIALLSACGIGLHYLNEIAYYNRKTFDSIELLNRKVNIENKATFATEKPEQVNQDTQDSNADNGSDKYKGKPIWEIAKMKKNESDTLSKV